MTKQDIEQEFENRDFSETTIFVHKLDIHGRRLPECEQVTVNVWDLMTNLIENQTEDVFFIDKLEELKSGLELHLDIEV
jgi:hypothetical protein